MLTEKVGITIIADKGDYPGEVTIDCKFGETTIGFHWRAWNDRFNSYDFGPVATINKDNAGYTIDDAAMRNIIRHFHNEKSTDTEEQMKDRIHRAISVIANIIHVQRT